MKAPLKKIALISKEPPSWSSMQKNSKRTQYHHHKTRSPSSSRTHYHLPIFKIITAIFWAMFKLSNLMAKGRMRIFHLRWQNNPKRLNARKFPRSWSRWLRIKAKISRKSLSKSWKRRKIFHPNFNKKTWGRKSQVASKDCHSNAIVTQSSKRIKSVKFSTTPTKVRPSSPF